jgi:nitroreductase
MNLVIEAISKRRSTRAYEQKPVPKAIINAIIEAGNQAPFTSVTRSQPWRFVVVQTPGFKQKLFQTAFPFWKNATDGMKEQYPALYEMATCLYNAMDKPKDVIYYTACHNLCNRSRNWRCHKLCTCMREHDDCCYIFWSWKLLHWIWCNC